MIDYTADQSDIVSDDVFKSPDFFPSYNPAPVVIEYTADQSNIVCRCYFLISSLAITQLPVVIEYTADQSNIASIDVYMSIVFFPSDNPTPCGDWIHIRPIRYCICWCFKISLLISFLAITPPPVVIEYTADQSDIVSVDVYWEPTVDRDVESYEVFWCHHRCQVTFLATTKRFLRYISSWVKYQVVVSPAKHSST